MASKDESYAIPRYIHSDTAGIEMCTLANFLKEYEKS